MQAPITNQPDGTVLVTGGTGTLGALFAKHLVRLHGARHLVLTSRQGAAAPGAAQLRAELEALGASVTIAAADVADRDAAAALIAGIDPAHPLTAVIHAAGTLDDGAVAAMTPERVDRVLAPKLDAAWHLHDLTRDRELAAFVAFSSLAGVMGGPGQSNYAAANAFLDALAHHRRARGLAGLSLAWGMWSEHSAITQHLTAEQITRMRRSGIRMIAAAHGLALFDAAVRQPHAVLVPAPFDRVALASRGDALPAVLRSLVRTRAARPQAASAGASASVAQRLVAMTPAERAAVLIDVVRAEAAGVLRIGAPSSLDPDRPFGQLGLDSLMAVELRNRLVTATGLRHRVPDIFEHRTVHALAAFLATKLPAGDGRPAAPAAPAASGGAIAPVVATAIAAREDVFELSSAQERLWVLAQVLPGNPLYNVALGYRVGARLDWALMQRCLATIAARHEPLRTLFPERDGRARAVVSRATAIAAARLAYVDLSGEPPADRAAKLAELASEHVTAPFDLARGPLWRATLVWLGDESVFLVAFHHIITDAQSGFKFITELRRLYARGGDGAALPALPWQYSDYVRWQRAELGSDDHRETRAWWAKHLEGMPRLDLPFERGNLAPSHAGASHHFTLSGPLSAGLRSLAEREQCTLFQTLLAAWATLLARCSGQRDFGIATASTLRDRSELRDLFGFFIETIVLRCDLSGEPSFAEAMHRVREGALQVLGNPIPFAELVQLVGAERGRDLTPLVQACFSFEPVPAAGAMTPAWTWLAHLRSDSGVEGTAKFNLCLSIIDAAELRGTIDYATDLFDAATIERMAGHLVALLGAIVDEPARSVAELTLLTAEEQRQIAGWNDTASPFPDGTVQAAFERQAARTPDAIAVVFEGSRLTYAELDRHANALAHALRAAGVGPDVAVGICLHRSLELIVALLAVLKAGGAYVPLDPTHPEHRLRMTIEDAGARLILTDTALLELLTRTGASAQLHDLNDATWWSEHPTSCLPHHVHADHLAYTIFTSGSTGRPKGAENTHRGLFNLLSWFQATFPLTASDAMLQKAPMSFDISAVEFFWPLLVGARLVVAAPEGHRDALYLASLIEREQVTAAHFVPSMLGAFLDTADVRRCGSLRLVFPGGEALSYELKERSRKLLPGAELHNLYGPTEAAVAVSWWPCASGTSKLVPIGRPIANTRLYVLDERMACVPVGVPGELYVDSVQLARGYLGRPELTAERFVPSPLGGGRRLYRTGDRARWLPDGNIEYLGRLDFQVKVRGFRIELGEIEAVLAEHPALTSSVVIGRQDVPGETRLVAYFVSDADVPIGELRAFLKARLPEYMVPALFVRLERMPLTSSGKTDRTALPRPDVVADVEYTAPRTRLEHELAAVFSQVLRVPRVGVTDNFFELGGDSIQVLKIVSVARDRRIAVRPAQVFSHQTVETLARVVRLEAPIEAPIDHADAAPQAQVVP